MPSDPADLLVGLNPEQAAAVQHRDGPLLILAGAGSGKTRVLTRRIAWLLAHGVRPWQILAVTFTNKAAGEMKERVAELVGDQARRVVVSTFHSSCARFLRQDIERLQFGEGAQAKRYTARFTIYDDDDQVRLIKTIGKDLRVDEKKWPARRTRSKIDSAKNRLLGPDELAAELPDPKDPAADIYKRYQHALLTNNAVDFGDLLGLMVRLLETCPEVRARYHDRFRYLMVDEYQDTNHAQYKLVRLLTNEAHNVAVVGDDDQSIYRFRGADIRNILDFERDFPEAKVVHLEQNYRSTSQILQAASAVVSNNHGRKAKTLWTDKGQGEPLRTVVGQDEAEEAALVVGEIERLRGKGVRLGEIGIIYRTNAASRAFEQVMIRKRMPHVLVGGLKFYQRREVRDLLGYLKLVLNPADDMAFLRVINVPSRGIGAKSVEGIREAALQRGVPLLEGARAWSEGGRGKARTGAAGFVKIIEQLTEASRRLSPMALVSLAVEASGYGPMLRADESLEAQGRLENLQELARALEEAVEESEDTLDEDGQVVEKDELTRLQEFLDRASLAGQAEELPDGDDGRVTMLTAHLAKGLEFPVVFVSGMYEGGFPHFMSMEREEDIEEERRLVYVAFTRAQERLYLCRPRRRISFGEGWRDAEPSRFLREIPTEVVQRSGSSGISRGGSGWQWGGSSQGDSRRERLGFGEKEAPAPRRPWQRPTPGFRTASSSPLSEPGTGRAEEPVRAPPPGEFRTREVSDPSELCAGARVVHSRYGAGTIRRADGPPHNLKVVVQFDQGDRKTLYARFAKLELLEA